MHFLCFMIYAEVLILHAFMQVGIKVILIYILTLLRFL